MASLKTPGEIVSKEELNMELLEQLGRGSTKLGRSGLHTAHLFELLHVHLLC